MRGEGSEKSSRAMNCYAADMRRIEMQRKGEVMADNKRTTTGAILKDLRVCHGISQRKLAKEVDVSNSTISRIEDDAVVPTGVVLVKLADYFAVSVGYLLGKED